MAKETPLDTVLVVRYVHLYVHLLATTNVGQCDEVQIFWLVVFMLFVLVVAGFFSLDFLGFCIP